MYKSEDLTSETADLVVKRAVRMLEIQKNSRELLRSVTRRLKEFEVTLQRQQLAFEAASGEQAVAQLDAAQKQVRVQRETALVNARIALEQAEEKLAKLRRDESIIVLKSPIDGVAVYGMFQNSAWQEWQPRTLAAGEKLAARTICMTVVQPGRVRVRLDVPESRITWLQPGMKARVVPHAVGALTYEGTVSDVPLAGVNGGYDVLIDLPKVDERIAPGYRATVRIDCGTIENALLVPVEAVNRGRVWVRTADGKDEERFVRIGRSDGKQVEILSGVEAGEFVLKAAKK
jgi:multidrug efflux pump subunit AcrA (membrane-fusion protein)